MMSIGDFEKQIDWNIYEKEEKALPSIISNNKNLLKGIIVKEKNNDCYSLIRFFKVSKDVLNFFDQIAKVLTCHDLDEVSGFLPFKKINHFKINNEEYMIVINPFSDYMTLSELDNLSETQKHKIIIKIVHSMSALHDHGIIYESLNPNNILITSNYEPLLFDYGLDQLIDQNHSEDDSNNIYLSPEASLKLTQNNNESQKIANITTKTDVFSFGIILYEFLSGKKMEKSLVVPLDFRSQIYIWVINSSINQNYHERPSFLSIEQYLLKVLPLQDDQELKTYIQNSKIRKEEHFEIKEKSISKTIIKFTLIYIILKKLFEFNLSYFLLFIIDLLIFVLSIPNIQLIFGALMIKKEFMASFGIKLVENAAHYSNKDALMYLGNLYELGKVVERNHAMAYCLYMLSYKKGKTHALNGIFQCIGTGNGTLLNSVRSEILSYKLSGIRYIDPTSYFDRISCQIRYVINLYRN